ENTVGVSQLLHDQGDSVDIPYGGGRGGEPNRVLLRRDYDFVPVRGGQRYSVGGEVNDAHVSSFRCGCRCPPSGAAGAVSCLTPTMPNRLGICNPAQQFWPRGVIMAV